MPNADVDVEDYFQVQAFAEAIDRRQWDGMDARVEANTDRILDQFARAGAHGTFFTLGWVAERHPLLVRRIVAAGHELASHGHGHAQVHADRRGGLPRRYPARQAVLEDTGGVAVRGYRAPTFSIGPRTPWAYDVLERRAIATAPPSSRSAMTSTASRTRRAFPSVPPGARCGNCR